MATNNINSSNYFSVSSYTNKGMSGMISGLDTESMVKQMLAATQKKIDTQLAARQRALWKQDAYRDIINAINGFKNKYFNTAFDASPLNNLASAKFFNAKTTAVPANSPFKVLSTSSTASLGDMSISVQKLATATKLTSMDAVGVSDNLQAGKALTQDMLDSFDKTLSLYVHDSTNSYKPTVLVDLNGINTQQAMVDKINDSLIAAGSAARASVDSYGKLMIETGDLTESVSVNTNNSTYVLQMTGLSANQSSSRLEISDTTQTLRGAVAIKPDAGVSLTVNLDGVEKQITLNPVATGSTINARGTITAAALADSLQEELNRAFGAYIEVDPTALASDIIQLNLNFTGPGGNEGHTITIYGTEAEKLGITPGSSSRLNTGSTLGSIKDYYGVNVAGDAGVFSFTINGKEFSFTEDDTIGTMINRINSGGAGVQMSYSSMSGKFSLTSTSTGSGYDITIKQTAGNLLSAIFSDGGTPMVAPGSTATSSVLTTGSINAAFTYAHGGLAQDVKGGAQYTVSLNIYDGVSSYTNETHTFTWGGDPNTTYTIDDVINSTLASDGIKGLNEWLAETYNPLVGTPVSDPAVIQAVNTAGVISLVIDSANSGSGDINTGTGGFDAPAFIEHGPIAAGAKFTVNVNGVDHTFTWGGTSETGYTIDNILSGIGTGSTAVKGLNEWLKDQFGMVGSNQAIEISYGGGGATYLTVNDPSLAVSFAASTVKVWGDNPGTPVWDQPAANQAALKDIAFAMGFSIGAKNNIATGTTALDDILQFGSVNVSNFVDIGTNSATGSTTLDDLAANYTYDGGVLSLSGNRLTLTATSGDVSIDTTDRDFFGGVSALSVSGGLTASTYVTKGEDALVSINNVLTTRSSNTFEIDGITIQLTSTSNEISSGVYEETVITTTRDTESVINSVKSFVEDYNAMMAKLYGYVNADASYKEYAPLTDEQKREMSDREIEKWEEMAQGGLLRRDSTVDSFLNSMYSLLYSRPISSSYALYDLGIEALDWKQPGVLSLDVDKFIRALEADPASVEALFTDPVNGLSKQMGNLMDSVARVSMVPENKGALVALAGISGSYTDTTSAITMDIARINDRLTDLWAKYEQERARYWKQFNAMEQLIANYQAQSAYIMQMFMDSGSGTY